MRGTWGNVREAGGVSAELLVCLLSDEEIQGLSAASAFQLLFHFQARLVAENIQNHQNLLRTVQLPSPFFLIVE